MKEFMHIHAKTVGKILLLLMFCFGATLFVVNYAGLDDDLKNKTLQAPNFAMHLGINVIFFLIYFQLNRHFNSLFKKKNILRQITYMLMWSILFLGFGNYLMLVFIKWLQGGFQNLFAIRQGTIMGLITLTLSQVIVVNVLFIVRIVKETIHSYKQIEQMKQQALSAKYDALQTQLNPHFLFNSLTTLIGMMEEKSGLAIPFTMHLSKIYRYILQYGQKKVVYLEEELAFIDDLLYLHKARQNNALKVTVDIEKKYMAYQLPPLSMQLLVENALKHNIVSVQRPLYLSFYMEDGKLVVENNLQKKECRATTRSGLANLRERYLLMFGEDITVCQTDCLFQVKLPLYKNKPV